MPHDRDLLIDFFIKEHSKMGVPELHVETLETLKESVKNLLITEHDLLLEEAEETVSESVSDDPEMWNENTDVSELAKHLASNDGDE